MVSTTQITPKVYLQPSITSTQHNQQEYKETEFTTSYGFKSVNEQIAKSGDTDDMANTINSRATLGGLTVEYLNKLSDVEKTKACSAENLFKHSEVVIIGENHVLNQGNYFIYKNRDYLFNKSNKVLILTESLPANIQKHDILSLDGGCDTKFEYSCIKNGAMIMGIEPSKVTLAQFKYTRLENLFKQVKNISETQIFHKQLYDELKKDAEIFDNYSSLIFNKISSTEILSKEKYAELFTLIFDAIYNHGFLSLSKRYEVNIVMAEVIKDALLSKSYDKILVIVGAEHVADSPNAKGITTYINEKGKVAAHYLINSAGDYLSDKIFFEGTTLFSEDNHLYIPGKINDTMRKEYKSFKNSGINMNKKSGNNCNIM